MQDKQGNELSVGDKVAYAVVVNRRAVLRLATYLGGDKFEADMGGRTRNVHLTNSKNIILLG